MALIPWRADEPLERVPWGTIGLILANVCFLGWERAAVGASGAIMGTVAAAAVWLPMRNLTVWWFWYLYGGGSTTMRVWKVSLFYVSFGLLTGGVFLGGAGFVLLFGARSDLSAHGTGASATVRLLIAALLFGASLTCFRFWQAR